MPCALASDVELYAEKRAETGQCSWCWAQTDQRPTNGRQTDQRADRPTTSQPSDGQDDCGGGSETDRDELVEVLRDEVAHLRDQLDRERDASAELRRIVAGLVQRVPELEAAPEPRDIPITDSGEAGKDDVPPDQQEPSQHRSWLYRFFLGDQITKRS
jgi:hypothetical protein